MGNIRMRPEELEQRRQQFLEDTNRELLLKRITHLMNIAEVRIIVSESGMITEFKEPYASQINQLKKTLATYEQKFYSDILTPTENGSNYNER